LTGLGSLEFRVTTDSAAAQRFFNQGFRLLYAFNHTESRRAFREAARLDPKLAMAYWGEAMALAPNLNAPLTLENGRAALRAARRAQALAGAASERERLLIAAIGKRYAANNLPARKQLDQAYAVAMRGVAERFPDDPDVQTLYADAVMNTTPWDYWQKDGAPKPAIVPVIAAIEHAIAVQPDHPGAHHYYIHVMEASNMPGRAEASADRLGSLMPAAGHMVHMPAHIYLRVGRYADAAEANVRAIAADEDYLAQCQAQGLYPVSYYPHNLHFLWAAATLEGRSQVAIDAAREVAVKAPHHHAGQLAWTADYPVTPMLAYARFGRWKDILTEPAPPAQEPYATGIWHYARALAFIAEHRLDRADTEVAALKRIMAHRAFSTTLKDLPLLTNLQIASRVAAGELAARRGSFADAVASLEEAVRIEDDIPYNEPPVWHQPPRQVLGAILLEGGRAADAERVYQEDLKRFPENGWSLFGLAQSLDAQGRTADAQAARERYKAAWARADISLTSSRILGEVPSHATKAVALATGVTLEYVEQGDRGAVPVVFLHGITDSWRSFERVLPLLPSSIHAFAISQRGHGGSSRPIDGYRTSDFAADVAGFLDAMQIRRAIVVGHSMGSFVAQRFAIDYPDRTAGLVLMGAFPTLSGKPVLTELWSAVSTFEDPVDPAFVEEFQKSTLARPIPAPVLATVVAESRRLPARVWKSAFAQFVDGDVTGELGRIAAPTLIAWGDRDTVCSREDQEVLQRGIRGARLIVYPGGGHGFHWEDPAQFASDLAAFVREAASHES
jgi:pimeloyl-ACP methyl ester carboxylesterase/tetratricopeptide (TPR) repeat protein